MEHERRLDIKRRIPGDQRNGSKSNGYNGPERRGTYDRRHYNERRQGN